MNRSVIRIEEPQEGNRLIAEFMGCDSSFDTFFNPVGRFHFELSEAEYHTSWDWLMPVVEKIESISDLIVDRVWVSINGKECGLWTHTDINDVLRTGPKNENFKVKNSADTKIAATWRTVIDFIQWYNSKATSTVESINL